ncbi:MAG: DNA cytosine methyltransferase [Acidobacteria bacterium]|nr:DNA cytosine methyltransferase [Acidobacteriota bacterium]MCI0591005.1 DNA cytosine methyltransferase [Gammaproteobacteria bacterium]
MNETFLPGPIPVVDIFAGPGGLSEGFASLTYPQHGQAFRICVSIEKDVDAHRTLLLRSFFRQFAVEDVPEEYYQYLRGEIDRDTLFEHYPEQAASAAAEACHLELGKDTREEARRMIEEAKGAADIWVLIGGPPCQAYSIAGRSRMRGKVAADQKKFEEDERHYLYREYLRIIAHHWPAAFVMENVKGLLSSKISDQKIFHKMLADLEAPADAVAEYDSVSKGGRSFKYRIFSLVKPASPIADLDPEDTIIKSEDYGIPQARHRVILLGIRSDLLPITPDILRKKQEVPVSKSISGLPKLRSGLTRVKDSPEAWLKTLCSVTDRKWLAEFGNNGHSSLHEKILSTIGELSLPRYDLGGEFLESAIDVGCYRDWYLDSRIGGVCNHSARYHMRKDLFRYMFAACYAEVYKRSPRLCNFPRELLPEHENAKGAVKQRHGMFADRFRVQLRDRPATTVTSHLRKDGHYFIHYDPCQCRSFTVREAARVQTFPDNYYFEGNRTSQYQQVGNAVPPLLARQIADIVYRALRKAVEQKK